MIIFPGDVDQNHFLNSSDATMMVLSAMAKEDPKDSSPSQRPMTRFIDLSIANVLLLDLGQDVINCVSVIFKK